ncbi:MAG: hypothetical protein R3D90_01085 [Paracoccaceae bacterium]
MTNNIKGPESTPRPPPSGQGTEGGSGLSFDQAIDRLLSPGKDTPPRLTSRQGQGNDAPGGGAHIGKRQDVMRTFAADRGTRLTEAWTGFTAGSRSFADLLGQVIGSPPRPPETMDTTSRIAQGLRGGLALSDLLPPSLADARQPLADPSPRSLGGQDAPRVADMVSQLVDTLLGPPGSGSPLVDRLSPTGLSALRDEAGRLASGLPPGEGTAAIRKLAREVIFNHILLPDLLSLAAPSDGPKSLGTAALSLHAILSDKGTGTLSPDLALALGPLRPGIESRFDDLLRALRLPGFTD